jgi:hypothetical protein
MSSGDEITGQMLYKYKHMATHNTQHRSQRDRFQSCDNARIPTLLPDLPTFSGLESYSLLPSKFSSVSFRKKICFRKTKTSRGFMQGTAV